MLEPVFDYLRRVRHVSVLTARSPRSATPGEQPGLTVALPAAISSSAENAVRSSPGAARNRPGVAPTSLSTQMASSPPGANRSTICLSSRGHGTCCTAARSPVPRPAHRRRDPRPRNGRPHRVVRPRPAPAPAPPPRRPPRARRARAGPATPLHRLRRRRSPERRRHAGTDLHGRRIRPATRAGRGAAFGVRRIPADAIPFAHTTHPTRAPAAANVDYALTIEPNIDG